MTVPSGSCSPILLHAETETRSLVTKLKNAKVTQFRARDIFRAAVAPEASDYRTGTDSPGLSSLVCLYLPPISST